MGVKVCNKMQKQHFALSPHHEVSWTAPQAFHQSSCLCSPPLSLCPWQRVQLPKASSKANRAGFSFHCLSPHSSSCTPGVHSSTTTQWVQRTLHHHESKFSCFINLHWFYCSTVTIRFPTVYPVVPSSSSKSINPRHSNKWQSKIIQESKNKCKK